MNISVPDALAEQVRRYHIPVSEVAQEALRQAVVRSRAGGIAYLRDRLLEEIEYAVDGRLIAAEDYPDDKRNPRSVDTLRALAENVRGLPDDDPQLGQLLDLDSPADFGRWDEYYYIAPWRGLQWKYTLRRLGFHRPETPQSAMRELLASAASDMADAEREGERAGREGIDDD